jgi:hypothetical protein
MLFERNQILESLERVHQIWSLRKVQLWNMGNGLVGVSGVWTPDALDSARERYTAFPDRFLFDPRTMSKWDLQTALWHRLETRRKLLYGELPSPRWT